MGEWDFVNEEGRRVPWGVLEEKGRSILDGGGFNNIFLLGPSTFGFKIIHTLTLITPRFSFFVYFRFDMFFNYFYFILLHHSFLVSLI